MKEVEYHPLAFEELIDSAEYYEARAERLGESLSLIHISEPTRPY